MKTCLAPLPVSPEVLQELRDRNRVAHDALVDRVGKLWDAGHDTWFIKGKLNISEPEACYLVSEYRCRRGAT